MKYLVLSLFLISFNSFSQKNYDTIYVSYKQTTYLVFPQDVDLVDLSNASQYGSDIDGKTVFIRSKVVGASKCPYLIKCGDDYWKGLIIYKEDISVDRTFYDFRNFVKTTKTTSEVTTVLIAEPKSEPIDTLTLKSKEVLISMKAEPIKIKTIGSLSSGIYIGLSNVWHSEHASYIRIKISNNTGISYAIKDIILSEKISSGNERFFKIICDDSPRIVPAKETKFIIIASELISVSSGNSFHIVLEESKGGRLLSLEVPQKIITEGQVILK